MRKDLHGAVSQTHNTRVGVVIIGMYDTGTCNCGAPHGTPLRPEPSQRSSQKGRRIDPPPRPEPLAQNVRRQNERC